MLSTSCVSSERAFSAFSLLQCRCFYWAGYVTVIFTFKDKHLFLITVWTG